MRVDEGPTADEPPVPVLLDANVLIDLLKLDALTAVAKGAGYELLVVDEVEAEIRWPRQRRALSAAIAADCVARVSLESLQSQEAYARLCNDLDSGEAACVAYAAEHSVVIASDETNNRFRRTVDEELGQGCVVRLEDLLAAAIAHGTITEAGIGELVEKLGNAAQTPRDRDDAAHLARVLCRLRSVLEAAGAGGP